MGLLVSACEGLRGRHRPQDFGRGTVLQTHWHATPRGDVFARHWGDPSLPRLLMLHGFPEYSGAWEDLAPLLSHRFHCIAPDQRGYGQTGGPDNIGAYRVSALVKDMVALIGNEPVTVLGHDWGASVAYGLAMFFPKRVSRLIVANGVHPALFQATLAAGGAQTAASQYIGTLRKEGSEELLAADDFTHVMTLFSSDMDLRWMTPARLNAYRTEWARPGRMKTMVHWYRASPLPLAQPGQPITDLPDLPVKRLQVKCPHLLIWGMKDAALLPESTDGLETFASDLTRISIADADHWINHQKPGDMAEAILNWIGQA